MNRRENNDKSKLLAFHTAKKKKKKIGKKCQTILERAITVERSNILKNYFKKNILKISTNSKCLVNECQTFPVWKQLILLLSLPKT